MAGSAAAAGAAAGSGGRFGHTRAICPGLRQTPQSLGFFAAGTSSADVPELGYAPQNMDRSVDPRQDFYRYAAGTWLKKIEIGPSDADAGGFTLLAHQLDQQLLGLIQAAAGASDAPRGSARQQVGDFYKAASDPSSTNTQIKT